MYDMYPWDGSARAAAPAGSPASSAAQTTAAQTAPAQTTAAQTAPAPQAVNGAQAVQVFDSWVGSLGPDDYVRYRQ